MNKIFGHGFTVPYTNLPQLYNYSRLLTPTQKTNLTKSLKTGSGMQIMLTRTQSGGFLGTLLASIGIPMVLKALTGTGMQVEPYRGGSKKHDEVSIRKGLIIGNY